LLINNDYLLSCDVVVTLCGDARDKCPMTPPSVDRRHWPFIDPAQATGSEAERLIVFREVRDEIQQRVADLVNELQTK